MLWSIHSGLSEQEGSVSGPISLLCLLLRLTMWSSSGAHPHINNGHWSPLINKHIHISLHIPLKSLNLDINLQLTLLGDGLRKEIQEGAFSSSSC